MTAHPARGTGPIRILVVDGHSLSRHGLDAVFAPEPDLQVVSSVGQVDQGRQLIEQLAPDLLVLDPGSLSATGSAGCADLIDAAHGASVVLTGSVVAEDVVAALRLGVRGYLLKDQPPQELIEDVRAVAQGEVRVSRPIVAVLAEQIRVLGDRLDVMTRGSATPGRTLTEREWEVLRLLAEGKSNKAIASDLFISDNTVKNHVRSILEKLEVRSRTEAALLARRLDQPAGPRS